MPKHTLAKAPASAGFRAILTAECPFVSLTSAQLDQLEAHYELLKRWNAKLNLTATLDIKKHFGESLFLGSLMLPERGSATVADIGSGGGFPGAPIAILHPNWKVTLVESDRRKSIFLRECAELAPNLHVLTARAEDLSGHFDWVVSRAVTPEFVAEVALEHAHRIGMILREAPKVAGITDELIQELPWPGTGVVWIGRCST